MSRQMIKLVVALVAIGALCCYLFYLNPNPILVTYRPNATVEAPLAIVLITSFFFGALVVGFASSVIAAFHALDDWQREKRYQREVGNRQVLQDAVDLVARENYADARTQLERILSREPTNSVAWSTLADVSLRQNRPVDALRVLDQARTHLANNTDILFRTAEANLSAGNFTAAYDNYSLILTQHPGLLRALKGIVSCAERLSRFDEAAVFTREIIRRVSADEATYWQGRLADFEFRRILNLQPVVDHERVTALQELLRRHRDYAPALLELGKLEERSGRSTEAAKLYSKAYIQNQDATALLLLSDLWLKQEDPSRAVQSVKAAVSAVRDETLREPGKLVLCALNLRLGLIDEARAELATAPRSPALNATYQLLRARIDGTNRDFIQALSGTANQISILPEVAQLLSEERHVRGLGVPREAEPLSPIYSTP